MMLQRGCILPNANFEKLNESISGKERLMVTSQFIHYDNVSSPYIDVGCNNKLCRSRER